MELNIYDLSSRSIKNSKQELQTQYTPIYLEKKETNLFICTKGIRLGCDSLCNIEKPKLSINDATILTRLVLNNCYFGTQPALANHLSHQRKNTFKSNFDTVKKIILNP